jgi:hypothetical protein
MLFSSPPVLHQGSVKSSSFSQTTLPVCAHFPQLVHFPVCIQLPSLLTTFHLFAAVQNRDAISDIRILYGNEALPAGFEKIVHTGPCCCGVTVIKLAALCLLVKTVNSVITCGCACHSVEPCCRLTVHSLVATLSLAQALYL